MIFDYETGAKSYGIGWVTDEHNASTEGNFTICPITRWRIWMETGLRTITIRMMTGTVFQMRKRSPIRPIPQSAIGGQWPSCWIVTERRFIFGEQTCGYADWTVHRERSRCRLAAYRLTAGPGWKQCSFLIGNQRYLENGDDFRL